MLSLKHIDKSKIVKRNICVIGAGHVGLVTASCFAQLGHKVICVDNDREKINKLKKKIIPFYEPYLEELVKDNVKKKRLIFTSSVKEGLKSSEIIFIAIGTPPLENGAADLTSLEKLVVCIAQNIDSYKLIVEKSTVPVNTGKKIKETILRYSCKSIDFDVASNPEFLREGQAIYDFFYPQRIVLGTETLRAKKILEELYLPFSSPIIHTDINTAELIKHASNSFLAMKISFINALSNICDLAGADVEKLSLGLGLDSRIGKDFLKAGIGYGGFCFPKDVDAFIYIAKELGYDFALLREVKRINERQKEYFIEKIKKHLWVLKGKKIGILGLSFKPGTDDVRFSVPIDIVKILHSEGVDLTLYDPYAMLEAKKVLDIKNIKFAKDMYGPAKSADCLCFLTEWECFYKIDFGKVKKLMRYPLIADGRNMFSPEEIKNVGFHYIGVGR